MSDPTIPNGNALTSAVSPWWAKLLDRFGIPTVLLGIVLWFGYQGLVWLAKNVFVPVTNGHVQLLHTVQEAATKQTEVLNNILMAQNQTRETNQKILESQNQTIKVFEERLSIRPLDVLEQTKMNTELLKQIRDSLKSVPP